MLHHIDVVELELRELETGQLAEQGGWSPGMQRVAEQCFRPPGSGALIPPLTLRRSLYTRYATTNFPFLSAAAVKLLSLHATTAAAERNWSGWGASTRTHCATG